VTAKAAWTQQARRALFDDAAAIVHAEYARDLTPDEVARRIATSRRQLQRVFAEVGGTSFSEYLTRVRLDRAADLLRESTAAVPEIARALSASAARAASRSPSAGGTECRRAPSAAGARAG